MFGSVLLDVAIGIVLTFLGVSLVSSAITEAISALFGLRQRTLRRGIQALLNDKDFTELAKDLYNHALISPLGTGTATSVSGLIHQPAYIVPRQFGIALSDVLTAKAARGTAPPSPDEIIEAIADPQLKQTVQALQARAAGLGTHLSDELGAWFDASMDRVSGWYKRRAQWIGFFVALLLAFILNADALHVATTLWDRPIVAANVARLTPDKTQLPALLHQLEQQNGLIGWQLDTDETSGAAKPLGWAGWLYRFLGWSITAAATLFGAAFWFDVLQRFVQVRATGTTPDEAARTAVLTGATRPAAKP